MKKVFAIVVTLCVFVLCSCEFRDPFEVAHTYSDNFVLSLDDGVEESRSYLHSDFWVGEERYSDFVLQLERAGEIDFSNGIEIISSENNLLGSISGIMENGSVYQYFYEVSVGEKVVKMFVVVVHNDIDYGVMYFGIYDPEL